MSSACDQTHARWLEAFVTGEAGVPPAERAALEACPSCRAELDGLRAMQGVLDAGGARRAADLELAAREAGEEEERMVRRAHARMYAAARPARPMPLAWAAAAALLVTALALWWGRGAHEPDDGRGPETLLEEGRDGPRLVSPVGTARSFATLVWEDADSAERTYHVEVWGLPEDGEPVLLLERDDLRGTRLELDPKATEAWPDEIEWTVRARGRDRSWIPAAEDTRPASRSSR